jgi:Arc/MetJ family transcription regulator
MDMHRTTVEIDTEALREAETALGTTSIKDTVNAALREVGRRDALARAAQYVLEGALHLPDEHMLAQWREPRS